MKKKILLFSLGAVILAGAAWVIIVPGYVRFGTPMRRMEGKTLSAVFRNQMEAFKEKHGRYPGIEELKPDTKPRWYKWGVGMDVAAFCPDCMITPDSYKIVIYGNIDDDSDVDVMIIMNDLDNPLVVKDDSL